MVAPSRIFLCRFLAAAVLLHVFTQCSALTRFQSPSRPNPEADGEGDVEESSDDEPSFAEKVGDDLRIIAVDQTPFFRWLRSGLKSEAKPSRFLDRGTQVEFLEEKEKHQFTRVRLESGKKGWVPTRLVKLPGEELTPTEEANEGVGAPTNAEPLPEDSFPELEPSRLPDSNDDLPPLTEDIGQPIIPGIGIIQPPTKVGDPEAEATEPADEANGASVPSEETP